MDEQNRNLILAMVLSLAVMMIWFVIFPPEQPVPLEEQDIAAETGGALTPPATEGTAPAGTFQETQAPTVSAVEMPRVTIETDRIAGSVSLLGGRIDTLDLLDYRTELEDGAPTISLLAPTNAEQPYFAYHGWWPEIGSGMTFADLPNANTPWALASGDTLTTETPLVLQWTNEKGLSFEREIAIDENYMFTITQTVTNNSEAETRLSPFGQIERRGHPQGLSGFFIIHEGAVRMSDGELDEIDYDNLPDSDFDREFQGAVDRVEVAESGWIGFTDHYWMTVLVPEQGRPFSSIFNYQESGQTYQSIARMEAVTVAPGASVTVTSQLFAGAKEWETIRNYEAGREIQGFFDSFAYGLGFGDATGIDGFIDSIDWGWFYFLTKPIFFFLHELNVGIGNMGWAILALTLGIKALLLPLAYKSYVSMAKMKNLQPEMEKIKERAGDDRTKLQQEMMELYKKEKVNPASGCLPILLQIPIFFSLYKVIFVTLELRHAPWIGWIDDLSAPDPSSLYNLWGIFPWASPEPGSILALVFIGILPLCLGVSMWLQQKLNPAPPDPTQAMIFAWMPWVFMFMLGSFASGLVIYWIANNVITFTQQYLIMRSQGMKPDVFGNIKSSFKKKPKTEPDPKPKKK